MKEIVKQLIYIIQIFILIATYWLLKPFVRKKTSPSWVVGVSEIGQTIHYLPQLIKPAVSVCLDHNFSYESKYNYSISRRLGVSRVKQIIRIVYGPLLLGYLMNKHSHFLYIWCTGFLSNHEFEFKFLKKQNKKLVCYFLGDDIRSPKLMLKYCKERNLDTFIDYVGAQKPYYISDDYDKSKKEIARIADENADLIFSAKIDQISYLKSEQHFFPYYFADNKFNKIDKFTNIEKVKIVHAPSNPFVKGTPLVRAAIKKLQEEGYDFEYVELQGMPNTLVLEHLKTAHILLNQFYGFLPGLLGIEGMANYCAVLMSADPSCEPVLPSDIQDAWMITKYWQVYTNLRHLLDNPSKIKYYAENGYGFTKLNYSFDGSCKLLKLTMLSENIYLNNGARNV